MASNAPRITTFTNDFLPAQEPSRRLVVVLHGRGDSLEGFRWLPGAVSLHKLNYLLVNGPLTFNKGFSWFGNVGDPSHDIERGRARLVNLFEELEQSGWPSEEIMLFGFSQGCVMVTDFALRWKKPLAGVVGVSGYIYFPETLEAEILPEAKQQKWLITHGTFDRQLPIERTRSQVRRLRNMGMKVEWREVKKDHSIDPGDEVAAIRDWFMDRWQ